LTASHLPKHEITVDRSPALFVAFRITAEVWSNADRCRTSIVDPHLGQK